MLKTLRVARRMWRRHLPALQTFIPTEVDHRPPSYFETELEVVIIRDFGDPGPQ